MAGFLLFGTLHSALMQWLLEWESKEERYSVRELRRYIYIYFFTFHFCFFDCTRVAHQGIQMALRGLVALQFLFLILYMCVYINMYPTYAYGVHSCMSACGSFNSQSIQKGMKSMSSEQC